MRNLVIFQVILIQLLLLACNSSFRDVSRTVIVDDLQFEYLTNPLGIDTETPPFS